MTTLVTLLLTQFLEKPWSGRDEQSDVDQNTPEKSYGGHILQPPIKLLKKIQYAASFPFVRVSGFAGNRDVIMRKLGVCMYC